MPRSPTNILIAFCGLLAGSSVASAGWVSVKNDTNQPVIVQETCTVNNQVRRGKPIKLMPGETLREFQSAAGAKTIHILEPGLLVNKFVTKGELAWKDDDRTFTIRKDGETLKCQVAGVVIAAKSGK